MNLSNEAAIVRDQVTFAIRASIKSRDVIAEEMSALVGHPVTLRALNSYTAESAKQNRFPLQYAIALCTVLGDFSILNELVERAGFQLIDASEMRLLEIGRAYQAKVRAEKTLQGVEL